MYMEYFVSREIGGYKQPGTMLLMPSSPIPTSWGVLTAYQPLQIATIPYAEGHPPTTKCTSQLNRKLSANSVGDRLH
jgi:hypothetical protein